MPTTANHEINEMREPGGHSRTIAGEDNLCLLVPGQSAGRKAMIGDKRGNVFVWEKWERHFFQCQIKLREAWALKSRLFPSPEENIFDSANVILILANRSVSLICIHFRFVASRFSRRFGLRMHCAKGILQKMWGYFHFAWKNFHELRIGYCLYVFAQLLFSIPT
jgi:hypothetical protein